MATTFAIAYILLSVVGLCNAAKTAYLLANMQQSNPANDTYATLPEILRPGVFDTIVLLSNYSSMPGQQQLLLDHQNLTITSAAGCYYTFTFNYITGAVRLSNTNITFRNLAMYKNSLKSAGQALPFFQGDGMILLQNVVRMRIGCAVPITQTFQTWVASPRPAAFPGNQTMKYLDFFFQGGDYPQSICLLDFAYLVDTSDVDESHSFTNYYLVERNVTRACLSYMSEECLKTNTIDYCFQQERERFLAQDAAGPTETSKYSVAVIVGPVIAGVVVVTAAVVGLALWHCRQRRAEQLPVTTQLPNFQQHQPSYDEKRSHSGAPGPIEGFALASTGTNSRKWCVLASHSRPEFIDVTPTDHISLGMLLGAGSFARVYKGVWHGMDVAVKVLQHDNSDGASVANEVDLFMSFRHPNIVQAYHFVTWKRTGIQSNAAAVDKPAVATIGVRPPSSKTVGSSTSTTPNITATVAEASERPQLKQQQGEAQLVDSIVPWVAGSNLASVVQRDDGMGPVPMTQETPTGQQESEQLPTDHKATPYGSAARQPVGQQKQSVGCDSRLNVSRDLGEAQTWLILEFCDGGTLQDIMEGQHLINKATGSIIMTQVLTLLCDIASGMLYLHGRNVLHGDLKPSNVLLKRQVGAPFGQQAKIADFGLSRSLNAGMSHLSTRTMGSVNHAAPELLKGAFYPAGDVYAFAIMMWELFTGKVAWSGMHYGEVFERVAFKQERPPVPDDIPKAYADLMVSAWGSDPFQRPTFDMILNRLEQMLASTVMEQQDAEDRFVADL